MKTEVVIEEKIVEVEKIVIKEAEKPQTAYKKTQTEEAVEPTIAEPTMAEPGSTIAEIAPPADSSPEETKEEQSPAAIESN